MLTIYTLFNDPNIVNAVIQRVLQTRKDTIYWQQYLDFRRTTTRVFKDYIGQVTGVMAGSINSRYGEKPIRERRNIGSGYGEIAYLGDRYQISVDRLSELQDLINKYNAAKPADQIAAMQDIVNFIYDDYRQVLLAPHKRMDMVLGSMLMTGEATVKNKDDNAGGVNLLEIKLPFKFITPETEAKTKFITYLQQKVNELKSIYGTFPKMIMSRGTFVKNIIGSEEFGDKFKMQLTGNEMYLSTGLITSQLASSIFTGIGLPAIEIKEDYVLDQTGKNVQIYADDRITLLPQDKIGYMRFHTPYEAVDGVPGRNYTQADGEMLISGYKDGNGRYLEYTAEWIPQITNPNLIVNFDLSTMNA
nr:MAG TPA: capsid protein [Caudoviricetes sp.]